MENIQVKLSGMEALIEQINPKYIRKQTAQAVSTMVNRYASALESRLIATYSVNVSEIRRAELSKSISITTHGKNIIKQGFGYRYKAKPLHTFPFRETVVAASSRFTLQRTRKGLALIKKTRAKQVSVAVHRGKYKIVSGGTRKGNKGFYQKQGSSKWAEIQGGKSSVRPAGIYAREQKATWDREPIDRAPISRLYGLSVSQMAGILVDHDPLLAKANQQFGAIMLESLQL